MECHVTVHLALLTLLAMLHVIPTRCKSEKYTRGITPSNKFNLFNLIKKWIPVREISITHGV